MNNFRKRRRSNAIGFPYTRRFSPLRFVAILTIIISLGALYESKKEAELPRSQEIESVAFVPASSSTEVEEERASSPEIKLETKPEDALRLEIESRQAKAREIFAADAGKLYVDESYGGALEPSESEAPIAQLSIPSLGFERQIWQGVGRSSNGVSGFGDDSRLYQTVTYRADQTLGGDNFTLVSHVWSGFSPTGKNFSNDWFSPLLTSVDGGMTTDLSKLKLKQGDEIVVTEGSTNLVFKFEISEIRTELHATADGMMTEEVKNLLMARPDRPRITLQGCLMNTDRLVFVIGELKSVSNGENTFEFG